MSEQERKRFEAWYRQEHPHQVCEWVSGSEKHGSGYTNNHTKELWKAWQAKAAECRALDGRVAISRDVAEAKGMYLVGYSWLKHNAPDELDQSALQPDPGRPIKPHRSGHGIGTSPESERPFLDAAGASTQPHNCRDRLQKEGKSYPRSSCAVCGPVIGQGYKVCPYLAHAQWQKLPPGDE